MWPTPDLMLLAAALTFQLPAPALDGDGVEIWSTNYVLHLAEEVPEGDGPALLGPGDRPYPAEDPIHLSERDWCQAALQGSARIARLDGSFQTINYATSEGIAVRCGASLGHPRWDSQGRVRFGDAVGDWGDGVRGLHLVPYRSLATDPAVIPTGTAVFIPSARGVRIQLGDREIVHDGWFFAADVGGAIRRNHIDTFTGTSRQTPLPHVTNTPDETLVLHPMEASLVTEVLRGLHR